MDEEIKKDPQPGEPEAKDPELLDHETQKLKDLIAETLSWALRVNENPMSEVCGMNKCMKIQAAKYVLFTAGEIASYQDLHAKLMPIVTAALIVNKRSDTVALEQLRKAIKAADLPGPSQLVGPGGLVPKDLAKGLPANMAGFKRSN